MNLSVADEVGVEMSGGEKKKGEKEEGEKKEGEEGGGERREVKQGMRRKRRTQRQGYLMITG